MKRPNLIIVVMGMGLMVFGLAATSLHAFPDEDLINRHCVPMLQPRTCSAIASSYCQEIAGQGGLCDGVPECVACNNTQGVGNGVCYPWGGETCTATTGQTDCANVVRKVGECRVRDSTGICACDMDDDGNCDAGDNTYVYRPCTPP